MYIYIYNFYNIRIHNSLKSIGSGSEPAAIFLSKAQVLRKIDSAKGKTPRFGRPTGRPAGRLDAMEARQTIY